MTYWIIIAGFVLFYFLIRERFIDVTIRARTPGYHDEETVYVCGNHEALGEWQKHVPLQKVDKGLFELKIRVRRNELLSFKFSLGSWETVEKGAFFNEIGNRSLQARKKLHYEFRVHNFSGFEEKSGHSTLSGNFEYLRNFQSRILHNSRNIIIYLPPSYKSNKSTRYPVLYMHDGNNIFDATTAFGGVEWEVDETVQKLIQQGRLEEIIVVGIYNTMGRNEEYTPVFCPKHGGGKGKDYLNFITKELMPVINTKFRTLTGPEHTGIMGSSLGGLISLYAAFEFPDFFGNAGVISPSLWWADRYMEKKYVPAAKKPKCRIWMDMGTLEGVTSSGQSVCIHNMRAMRKLLLQKGFIEGEDLMVFEHEGGTHDEATWASRVHMPLLYFFSDKSQEKKLKKTA
jgi:predicted alpha/beta superfamily hydrolase